MLNAKDWAKPFSARILEPGLVSYEDSNCGKVLLRKETIDRDIHSFVGRPLIVKQNRKGRMVHAVATPENMKVIGHGYITQVYYNNADGWWWGKGLADTDEAVDAIQRVGKCSCAYGVTKAGPPDPKGWHDIPYQEEILGFSGEHLAVVDNPRYEDAHILLNAKNPTGTNMSFLAKIKRLAAGPSAGDDAAALAAAATAKAAADAEKLRVENAKKDGAESIGADTSFTIPGQKEGTTEEVTLASLIESHHQVAGFREVVENAKKNGVEMEEGDTMMYNGKPYVLSNAMVEAFDKWAKVNAADEDKEKADKEKADKENKKNSKLIPDLETAEEIAAKEDAERKRLENAGRAPKNHFNVLLNARDAAPPVGPKATLNTLEERLENGRNMFGSKKKS